MILFQLIDIDTNFTTRYSEGIDQQCVSHDNDPKQFSARFNNAIIQADPLLAPGGNPTEASALDEIQQLIDLIYSKPETAKNICWKIYRFFVYAPHTPAGMLLLLMVPSLQKWRTPSSATISRSSPSSRIYCAVNISMKRLQVPSPMIISEALYVRRLTLSYIRCDSSKYRYLI